MCRSLCIAHKSVDDVPLITPVGVEYSDEECSLAVGKVIGCESLKASSRINSSVVIFLHLIVKVNIVVEQGIVLRNTRQNFPPY